jgi:hypothetical protein
MIKKGTRPVVANAGSTAFFKKQKQTFLYTYIVLKYILFEIYLCSIFLQCGRKKS